MIQELFGGGANGLINRDRNVSVFEPSPSPSSSSTTTTTTTTAPTEPQKLRCPRCDSSNTKFCYYNNYNLTQPRHFCKTCRRYWTKGGALRNVPIGGGCRKNKGTTIAASVGKPISATGKLKAVVSSELIGNSGFLTGFDHEFPSNPNILWAAPPQTSHLLSLLRATQNPNPNFALNSVNPMKDQSFLIGSNLGFDSQGHTSSLGLCSSLWRSTNQNQENHGVISAGQNTETGQSQSQLYERLRSSLSPANYYNQDQSNAVVLGGNVAANTSGSSILESAPVVSGGGDPMGFWNPALPVSWSDLPANNGEYP